ncbi:DUF2937 family protein [Thalassotalea atypica]|uniref:DUF2937 family protein n=1 Tax=Thalassotalea atypica TaxID=2054316 RepID=UPI002573AE1A|nr:DUF2937 family protein [Thalassotalea atypica]
MIRKFFVSSIDHAGFTLSFIVGVQLPEFIQQYTQMINGKLAEAQFHLSKFQSVANNHFNGDLQVLVERYTNNADPAIKQTGIVVSELIDRIALLSEQLSQLTEVPYMEKLYYFIVHLDLESAQLTAQHYQLAVPLTIDALLTGALFASFIILIPRAFIALLSAKSSKFYYQEGRH